MDNTPNRNLTTALYCRLSVEDMREGESQSIENQKMILQQYADDHGFHNCQFYVDDGYSGVDSTRPAYVQMLKDIEDEKIGTVIVKDQSRLGRDHLETDRLMELTFPSYDVRFIAVTDGVDSINGINEMSGMRNFFNDFFARDTSKKIRAVQRAKGKRGERVGTTIPYGYMKNPDNPKQLVPNPETAPIVKRIFEMYASGIGIRRICATFEREEILCPSVYAFRMTGNRSGNPNLDKPYRWSITAVRKMLSNEFYCGDTVNFKTYSKSNKLKKRLKNPPEKRLVFRDTHEAIVSRKLFDTVQKHFAGRKRPDVQGEMDKFTGYLFCAECGARLYMHRGKTIDPKLNAFQCGGYQTKGNSHCTSHYIRESVLNEIVLNSLRQMTAYARENTEEFYAMATANGEAEAERFYATAERQKTQITVRISQLDNIIRCLYEDRVTGRITPERYDTMASGYELEQAELRQELQCITKKIDEMDLREMYVKEFIAKTKTYIEMPELTPELLRVFIRRIEVYEKAEKYSRTCGNRIVIHYTFQAGSAQRADAVTDEVSEKALLPA